MNTQQILVLGMHRSGTSALTGLIAQMGAYAGEAHELLPADNDNPKGFFERKDVISANQAIMKHLGCNWFTLNAWDEAKLANLTSELLTPIKNIIDSMNKKRPWVIKEPRLCLTLPCWLPLLDNPIAIIMYRDPLEIAQSLFLRNSIDLKDGLALWETYVETMLKHSANMPRVFCNYDALIANPVAATKQLFDGLTTHRATLTMPSDTNINAFIVPSLKRALRVNHALSAKQHKLIEQMQGR